MPAKMVPKIILEGTRLTLKTELAFALNEYPRIADFMEQAGGLWMPD